MVPHGNSLEKNPARRAGGAELVEHGRDCPEARARAEALASSDGLHFVPSFHRTLLCGVASYALELFEEIPRLDAVYVPIGLGSGICGTVAARNALALGTEVIGVVSAGAPAYHLSMLAGRPVAAEAVTAIADGMAVRIPDPEALAIIRQHVARLVVVSDAEIRAAMRHLFTDTHNVAEGAGAASLAGLLQESQRGRRVAVILSGANVDAPTDSPQALGVP